MAVAKTKKSSGMSTDILVFIMVILMSIAANMPEEYTVGIDRRYLIAGLIGIVGVSLIMYLKFLLVLSVVVLAVGANLPEQIASELHINTTVMLFALVVMVVVSFANHFFNLPTSGSAQQKAANSASSNAHGGTALFGAIAKGRLPTVKALLTQGVSSNMKTKTGQTALMYAAYKGYGDIVQLLLDNGADLDAVDAKGKSALMFAQERGYTRVAELLKASSTQNKQRAI